LSGPVSSVAVVGRDAPLWLAVIALKRALGRTDLRIHAVELRSRLTAVDAYAAMPTLGSMHRLLGIDERLVLQACNAVPVAAQRFSNWSRSAPPVLLAYDDEPRPGELSFVQFWTKGVCNGLRVGIEEFSLGAACARLNAVPVPVDDDNGLAASYGYHLDASAYAALLKQLALRLGVEAHAFGIADIEVAGPRIEAIKLGDGASLEADLYIDASGREAALLSLLAGAEFESWREWLPCDRMLAASGPRLVQLPSLSQISAFRGGWIGQFPLQDRTAVTTVYNSAAVTEGEVVEMAGVIAGSPISGDAVLSVLDPGMQRLPWIGNCVAIGGAAVAVDPVDALDLHVTHACISHLMTSFPACADEFPEADAYNAAIRCFGNNARDFQAAHYILNRRFDETLWDAVRDAAPPPSLKRKFDLFSARAVVPMNEEEPFHEQHWATLLLGCGIVPEGYDPRVDAVPDETLMRRVQQRLRDVAALARQMPTVEQFLALEQPLPAVSGA